MNLFPGTKGEPTERNMENLMEGALKIISKFVKHTIDCKQHKIFFMEADFIQGLYQAHQVLGII